MPLALNAAATSLSRPAQPPSPDSMMANVSDGAVPDCAATETIGRSFNASGAFAAAAGALRAKRVSNALMYSGDQLSCAGAGDPLCGVTRSAVAVTSAAPGTWATKLRMAPASQACGSPLAPAGPRTTIQGLPIRRDGRNSTPPSRARGLNSTPEPLHKRLL